VVGYRAEAKDSGLPLRSKTPALTLSVPPSIPMTTLPAPDIGALTEIYYVQDEIPADAMRS
jgi:hypothetical protein